MTPEDRDLGELIRIILREHNLSVRAFCDRYGFTKSTLYEWINDRGGVTRTPYRVIEALADVARATPADIFLRLGIDVLVVPSLSGPIDFDKISLYPLVEEIGDNALLKRAITTAIEGRRIYCYEGTLDKAYALYKRAVDYAIEAEAFRLATYLKAQLCNICEMTGKLDLAEDYYNQAFEEALRIQHDAIKAKDEYLKSLATRLALKAKIHWFWADYWARGTTTSSIPNALNLLRELKNAHYHQKIPYIMELLARCSINLGDTEQAIEYISDAAVYVYALPRPEFAKYELFLDAGGILPTGRLDYSWQEDQIRAAKTDILIAAGRPEEAFEVYQTLEKYLAPRAHLSFHNWYNPLWQEYLRMQAVITEDMDVKVACPFNDYADDLEGSGDLRVLALNTYSQGENDTAHEDFLWAGCRFQAALKEAAKAQANDVVIRSALAGSRAAIMQGNKPLAISRLSVIEEIMHHIDNPFLQRIYRNIQEEIAQL